jgi:hypothetical protein
VAAAALAVAVALVSAGTEPAAASNGVDSWPSQYGGPGNTTFNAGESVLTTSTATRVTQAWSLDDYAGSYVAPAVAAGVAYHVDGPGPVTNYTNRFTATAVRTGATSWTLQLPVGDQFLHGMTVVGRLAVMPFNGNRTAGGVLAVDLQARRIAWTSSLPPSSIAGQGNAATGYLAADTTRAYVGGSSNVINAFRLSDGALLWTAPYTYTSQSGGLHAVNGIAVGSGAVFTGGDEGIVAYDAASGRRLWNVPGYTYTPMVTGGRVYAATSVGVLAVSAGGCGGPTCRVLWSKALGTLAYPPQIGGANGTTLFATFTRTAPSAAAVVARLSASTGAVQWSATTGLSFDQPVRAGNVLWVRNWYRQGDVTEYRLLAYGASTTGTKPLRSIPGAGRSIGGGVAVAGGTVIVQLWPGTLAGFRAPGT